jgi:hypothetical protein
MNSLLSILTQKEQFYPGSRRSLQANRRNMKHISRIGLKAPTKSPGQKSLFEWGDPLKRVSPTPPPKLFGTQGFPAPERAARTPGTLGDKNLGKEGMGAHLFTKPASFAGRPTIGRESYLSLAGSQALAWEPHRFEAPASFMPCPRGHQPAEITPLPAGEASLAPTGIRTTWELPPLIPQFQPGNNTFSPRPAAPPPETATSRGQTGLEPTVAEGSPPGPAEVRPGGGRCDRPQTSPQSSPPHTLPFSQTA